MPAPAQNKTKDIIDIELLLENRADIKKINQKIIDYNNSTVFASTCCCGLCTKAALNKSGACLCCCHDGGNKEGIECCVNKKFVSSANLKLDAKNLPNHSEKNTKTSCVCCCCQHEAKEDININECCAGNKKKTTTIIRKCAHLENKIFCKKMEDCMPKAKNSCSSFSSTCCCVTCNSAAANEAGCCC